MHLSAEIGKKKSDLVAVTKCNYADIYLSVVQFE
jgi:hypothetical protein